MWSGFVVSTGYVSSGFVSSGFVVSSVRARRLPGDEERWQVLAIVANEGDARGTTRLQIGVPEDLQIDETDLNRAGPGHEDRRGDEQAALEDGTPAI